MQRLIDVLISSVALLILFPVLSVIALLIYAYDGHSPFYVAPRIGWRGKPFRMIKFRSMVVNADRSGVNSTSSADMRITPVGRFVRRYKLDEIVQLWNVLKGDMSLVGPRPNVEAGTRLYTSKELRLLTVRPGITDFASIVFSDEGEILRDYSDADAAYDVLIRPWKSRLGLYYIDVRSVRLNVKIICLTITTIFSRPRALRGVSIVLHKLGAPTELINVALRLEPLREGRPPS
jgi:lipopolysaccharide/colanic/teichoic acid biosynthesis glycosyltransferase